MSRKSYFDFKRSRPTAALTWRETATTQVYMKEEPKQQSNCFALTSNNLLDRPSGKREAENADICEICEKPMIAKSALEEFFHTIWDVHAECGKNDFSLD